MKVLFLAMGVALNLLGTSPSIPVDKNPVEYVMLPAELDTKWVDFDILKVVNPSTGEEVTILMTESDKVTQTTKGLRFNKDLVTTLLK